MSTEVSTKQDQWQKLFAYLLGNQAAWIADIGLKAGLFRAIADAGEEGITEEALAAWPRDALFVNTRRDQPNGLAAALGCEVTAAGTIVTDADGRTNVAGVYAAGDAATAHSRSVANAIGTGSRVAYAVTLERLAPVVTSAA